MNVALHLIWWLQLLGHDSFGEPLAWLPTTQCDITASHIAQQINCDSRPEQVWMKLNRRSERDYENQFIYLISHKCNAFTLDQMQTPHHSSLQTPKSRLNHRIHV